MDKLTRAELLNYGDINISHNLLDLTKYGFADRKLYEIVNDKNPFILKQEYGSMYIYLHNVSMICTSSTSTLGDTSRY
jgi:hypothetical protein